MHELTEIIFLLDPDGLCELTHLLIEECIGNVLHVTVEVRDRVLRKLVTRQHSTLVA